MFHATWLYSAVKNSNSSPNFHLTRIKWLSFLTPLTSIILIFCYTIQRLINKLIFNPVCVTAVSVFMHKKFESRWNGYTESCHVPELLVLWKIVVPICIWIGKFNAQCTRKPTCVSACGTRVCSLTYRPCNEHGPYCLWPLWLHYIFRHFLINGTIFGKKLPKIECVFWFSLQLCLKYYSFKKTWARYCHKYENMFTRSTYSSHSFISNLSDDRSTASSKTIPPLNAI
jgi:hypothetical protein